MSKTKEEWEELLIEIEQQLREENAKIAAMGPGGSLLPFGAPATLDHAARRERVKFLKERIASIKAKISELAATEEKRDKLYKKPHSVRDQLEMEPPTSPKRKQPTTVTKAAEYIPKHKLIKDGVDKMLTSLRVEDPSATLDEAKRIYANFAGTSYSNVNKAYHYKGKK